ncbi:hypothetical protein MTO96_047864 [Rhipicephalus appendiculatus]
MRPGRSLTTGSSDHLCLRAILGLSKAAMARMNVSTCTWELTLFERCFQTDTADATFHTGRLHTVFLFQSRSPHKGKRLKMEWGEECEPAEDWETEICPGFPGYLPRTRPTFQSTAGMKRCDRKRHYRELVKQAEMRMQMQDLEEKAKALGMQGRPHLRSSTYPSIQDARQVYGTAAEAAVPCAHLTATNRIPVP